MNSLPITLAVAALAATAQSAQAQVVYDGFTIFTQNFDTLPSSGTSVTFTNNATLLGWYANQATLNAEDGSVATAKLKSFGTPGSSDRALGSIASGSLNSIKYGVRIQNNSGADISQFTLSYTGEEWRGGGSTTAQKLSFSYAVFDSGSGTLTTPGYTNYPSLDFTTPVMTSGNVALNGNDPVNRAVMTATVTGLSWSQGSDLWLTWTDVDDPGNDAGLAIDDLSFTTPASAPEPSCAVTLLLGFGTLGLAGTVRRFRTGRTGLPDGSNQGANHEKQRLYAH